MSYSKLRRFSISPQKDLTRREISCSLWISTADPIDWTFNILFGYDETITIEDAIVYSSSLGSNKIESFKIANT